MTPPPSLLDTDLYKFTMWQAFLHQHPGAHAEYSFVCRNSPAFPLASLVRSVNIGLDRLCDVHFTAEEIAYLRTLRYLKSDFVDFLELFHFQRRFIGARAEGERLVIEAKGPQVHVMAFEVPVLALVNEIYFARLAKMRGRIGMRLLLDEGRRRLSNKIDLLHKLPQQPARRFPFEFFDFGTRRRFSRSWHEQVVMTLKERTPEYFKGTSNVLLAQRYNLVPIGTMAHEYLQSFQAFGPRLRDFQKAALESWVQEYRGDLGIALTDTVGMLAFERDFDQYFGKLFDGLRHDSGDPVVWGEQALALYQRLRIDAATKRLVFSDGLDLPKAIALHQHFGDRVPTGYGIGTNLSNDLGSQPLNIVMKLMRCNGQPVAKLSDSPGKTLCEDQTFLAYLRQVFDVPSPLSKLTPIARKTRNQNHA